MLKTLEATIDKDGQIHFAHPVTFKNACRALVTILDEPNNENLETTFFSEPSLSADWLKPEEDEAWSHLQ